MTEPIIAPMPGSIVKAHCAVAASLHAIAKNEFNKHGQYKFVSTDDIYAGMTKKLGEVGLMIYPLELEPVQEISSKVDVFDQAGLKTGEKTITKLRFRFGYMLATEQDSWFDPRSARTIIVLHTGPQTFAAAESFCQKAYLRGTFKIPTGEKDLDSMPQADTEEEQVALNTPSKVKRKSSAAGKRDGTDKRFAELTAKLAKIDDAQTCDNWWADHLKEIEALPRAWHDLLSEDYFFKMKEFGVEMEDVEAAE